MYLLLMVLCSMGIFCWYVFGYLYFKCDVVVGKMVDGCSYVWV